MEMKGRWRKDGENKVVIEREMGYEVVGGLEGKFEMEEVGKRWGGGGFVEVILKRVF